MVCLVNRVCRWSWVCRWDWCITFFNEDAHVSHAHVAVGIANGVLKYIVPDKSVLRHIVKRTIFVQQYVTMFRAGFQFDGNFAVQAKIVIKDVPPHGLTIGSKCDVFHSDQVVSRWDNWWLIRIIFRLTGIVLV